MFGWDRKKKPEKKQESGLMYAGSPATQHREVDLGETHHTYKTEDGTLYMRDTALHLVTKQGTITAPYHTIDVWEYTGKSFHVWWTTSTHNYTFACRPEMSPAEDLQNIIHKKTFEESVLLFEVGRSVGYICKKQSFVWGNMHYLAKYSVRN